MYPNENVLQNPIHTTFKTSISQAYQFHIFPRLKWLGTYVWKRIALQKEHLSKNDSFIIYSNVPSDTALHSIQRHLSNTLELNKTKGKSFYTRQPPF
jgi:hypothetical protein